MLGLSSGAFKTSRRPLRGEGLTERAAGLEGAVSDLGVVGGLFCGGAAAFGALVALFLMDSSAVCQELLGAPCVTESKPEPESSLSLLPTLTSASARYPRALRERERLDGITFGVDNAGGCVDPRVVHKLLVQIIVFLDGSHGGKRLPNIIATHRHTDKQTTNNLT